jgi:hypothetical protein
MKIINNEENMKNMEVVKNMKNLDEKSVRKNVVENVESQPVVPEQDIGISEQKPEQEKVISEQEKKLIEDEIKERTERCSSNIIAMLKTEGCRIDVAMVITPQGNIPQLTVVNAKQ